MSQYCRSIHCKNGYQESVTGVPACSICNSPKDEPSEITSTRVYTHPTDVTETFTLWDNGQCRYEGKMYPMYFAKHHNLGLLEQGYSMVETIPEGPLKLQAENKVKVLEERLLELQVELDLLKASK
jgi:hypothetical protein